MAQTHNTQCMLMHACSHRACRLDHAIGRALGAWFGCGRSGESKSTALFSDVRRVTQVAMRASRSWAWAAAAAMPSTA